MSSRQSWTDSAAIAALAISLLVSTGWLAGIEILQSFVPNRIGMKPITAMTFVALSSAFLMLSRERKRGARVLISLVLLVASLALVEYVTKRNMMAPLTSYIEPAGAVETVHAGRMAPHTAAAFFALGLVALASQRSGRRAGITVQLLSTATAGLGFFVILGYVYGIRELRGPLSFSPMALPTAVSFFLLSYAFFRVRTDLWPMTLLSGRTEASNMARVLLPFAFVLPCAGGLVRLIGEKAGLYGTAQGVALFTVFNIATLLAAILWTTTRLHQAGLARQHFQTRLHQTVLAKEAMGSIRDRVPAVQKFLCDEAQKLTSADGAVIVVAESRTLIVAMARGIAVPLSTTRFSDESFVGTAIAGNESIVANNALLHTRIDPVLVGVAGEGSILAVPFSEGGQVKGAMVMLSRHTGAFTADDVTLLELLVRSAGPALRRAHEFETEQAIASEQTAEIALLQQQFTAFMGNLPAATFIKDCKGHYLYGNPLLRRLLGVGMEQILGARDRDILPAKITDLLERDEVEVVATSETVSRMMRLLDHDTAEEWLLLRFPIASGEKTFIGGVAVDITEYKRAENEIAELNASLERKVDERTEQLAQANGELESFSYSVSHDLRAPLRAVDGYARILQEDYASVLDDEGNRFIATIRSEANRMGELIDDLLRFSKVNRQSLSIAPLDLSSLAEEVMREVQKSRPEREIEFRCELLPATFADRATMRQVLVNLLSNSVKYAKPDGVIDVSMGGRIEGEETIYWVTDRGVGFDPRYAGKLFKVFQRLHSDEEFEGTGVGLAIVERVISRHGGRVWADSSPGHGATFYFTLPMLGTSQIPQLSISLAITSEAAQPS